MLSANIITTFGLSAFLVAAAASFGVAAMAIGYPRQYAADSGPLAGLGYDI